MSEPHGKRRRSDSSKGPRSWPTWVILGIVALLLAANLVAALPGWMEEGEPTGWLTPGILRTIGLWVPAVGALLLSGLGLWWTSRAVERGGRPGAQWGRRGFFLAVIGILGLVTAVFEPETFPRENLVVLFFAFQLLLVLCFAFSARDYAESRGGRRGSHGQRSPGHGKAFGHADGDAHDEDPER